MTWLLLSVPLAPLAVALILLIWGRRLPRRGGYLNAAGSAVAVIALLALSGRQVALQGIWGQTGALTLTMGLVLEPLTYFMALLVALISLLVNLYAISYMAEEEGQRWFFAALSFFVGAMLTLVLANSFILLFAAWEGVGLASFLLIGFWYRQEDARRAAQKAFLLTRLGDVGLLLGWLLAAQAVNTTDIKTFLDAVQAGTAATGSLTLLALLFFAGAVGKSAQLPLTAWLPAAMAGPTPVSALIHSATMVAAGVYLLLRLFPLFEAAPYGLAVGLGIGGVTALFAALVATTQYDLKRVLAWSTVSQLGEMMLALGLAGPLAAAFHLATHAVFKSALFLTAGAVEHATGSRDLRQLGRLMNKMPLTALVFGLAALALAGIPPFAGFWSEDKILGAAVATGPGLGCLMLLLIFLAGVYISRAGAAVFRDWPDAPAPDGHDPGRLTTIPMGVLALLAAGAGWLLSGELEKLLPFAAGPELSLVWRIGAVTAGLLGVAFGLWRVHQRGPVPAFGSFPALFERGLTVATQSPARLAGLLANGLDRIERGLDQVAQRLGRGVLELAGLSHQLEQGLDNTGAALAATTLGLADASDTIETQGFSAVVDRFAALFSQAGGRLRTLQTGKLYLYTLGLFIWVLVVGIFGVLLWF